MNTTAPKLTGIVKANSTCDCCGRKLGKVFQLSDGGDYGRACATKITGYKVTDQAARIAATLAKNEAIAADLSAKSAPFAHAWRNITEGGNASASAMESVIAVREGWSTPEAALALFDRMTRISA